MLVPVGEVKLITDGPRPPGVCHLLGRCLTNNQNLRQTGSVLYRKQEEGEKGVTVGVPGRALEGWLKAGGF